MLIGENKMTIYECRCCGKRFWEPGTLHTTYESWYGVSSMVSGSHSVDVDVCPNCESEDYDEIEVDDDYDEGYDENFFDPETMISEREKRRRYW